MYSSLGASSQHSYVCLQTAEAGSGVGAEGSRVLVRGETARQTQLCEPRHRRCRHAAVAAHQVSAAKRAIYNCAAAPFVAAEQGPGTQGWRGRWFARVAGCQNVATPAGFPGCQNMMTGNPKPSSTPQLVCWTRTIAITVIIRFLLRFTENFGLESVSNIIY